MGNIEIPGSEICHGLLFPEQTNVILSKWWTPATSGYRPMNRADAVSPLPAAPGVCAPPIRHGGKGLTGLMWTWELRRGSLHIDIEDGTVFNERSGLVRIMKGVFYL